MTRSKSSDLHLYNPKIDKTFHRLSISNKSRSVVVHDSATMHDSVVLDSSVEKTEFIVDSVFEPVFIASDFEKKNSVDIMADNNQTLKELATPDVVYQPWCIQYPETKVSYELMFGKSICCQSFMVLQLKIHTSI